MNDIVYALDDTAVSDTESRSETDAAPSVSLAWLDSVDDNLLQKEVTTGTNHINIDFNVEANAIDKYEVVLQATSTSSLVGSSTGDTINTIEAETSYNNFPKNAWGYAVAVSKQANPTELTYLPISTNTNTAAYTTEENNVPASQDFTLVFAANLDNAKPDHYKNNVILSVVAGAEETNLGFGAGEWRITTMQEMTQATCHSVQDGATGRLKDVRDGEVYWVAKMRDGNCWMTQNLDFNIPATLSEDTSDVLGKAVTTSTARINLPTEWTETTNDYNAYYDPGEYIYIGTDESHGSHGSVAECNVTTDISICGYLLSKEGDTHYSLGNYYTFSAATVKSGDTISTIDEDAQQSICPKGWRLPRSGNNNDSNAVLNKDKSFARLFESYGWQWDIVNKHPGTTNNGGTNYELYKEPFYFVYSGYLSSAAFRAIGWNGSYWSAAVFSDVYISYLAFNNDYVYPALYNSRYYGFNIRCVAR